MVMVGVIESTITLGTGDFGKSIDFVMGGLKRMAGALYDFGQDSLNASMDFNRSMANIGSLIPGNTERVLELKGAVQQMAEQTGKSTEELAGGMYEIIGAFGDSEDSVARLRTATDLASAGLATTKDAMALIAAETRAYGDTSSETAAKVADLATMAVNLGQTTLPELAAAMPRVTALSSQMGISFEEMNAVMATFTGVTGNAAEVATQMRGMLQALAAPSEQMKTLFEEWGVSTGREAVEMMGLQGVMESVNERATELGAGGLQALVGSIEGQTLAMASAGEVGQKYAQNLGEMQNASGATAKALAEQNDGIASAAHAWDRLSAGWGVFSQRVGQVLEPAFGVIWDALREGINVTSEWLGKIPDLTEAIRLFAVDSVAWVKGTLVPGLVEAWPGIKQGFVDAWEGIKAFIAGDTDAFISKFAAVGVAAGGAIGAAIEKAWPYIEASFRALLERLLGALASWISQIPGRISSAVGNAVNAVIPAAPLSESVGDWTVEDLFNSLLHPPGELHWATGRHAAGGPISGPGTGTSDSIRAYLSNGEHVWTAKEVEGAGGHRAVEALRGAAARGFAEGGPVGSRSNPLQSVRNLGTYNYDKNGNIIGSNKGTAEDPFRLQYFADTFPEKMQAILGSFSADVSGMFPGLSGAQQMFDQMNQGALQAQSGNTFFDFGALRNMQEGNLNLLRFMEKGSEGWYREWMDRLIGTSASWVDSLQEQRVVMGQATEAQSQAQTAMQSMIEPLQTASMGLAESAAASAAAAASGATFGQTMAISSQMVALGAGQMAGAFATSSMSMGLAAAGTISMIDQQLARYGDVTTELGKQLAGGYGITGAVVAGDASGIGHGASFTPPPGWNGFSWAQGLGGGTRALSPGFGQQPNIIVQIDGEAVFRAVQNHAATYGSQNPGMWV